MLTRTSRIKSGLASIGLPFLANQCKLITRGVRGKESFLSSTEIRREEQAALLLGRGPSLRPDRQRGEIFSLHLDDGDIRAGISSDAFCRRPAAVGEGHDPLEARQRLDMAASVLTGDPVARCHRPA
jgi:hypothetical protein